MRQRIASGEWTDRLPGERRLADMLQVGRDTVRLMLSELTAEGLITPAVYEANWHALAIQA